ncbi:hypothetical protein BDZ89DRAFT_535187 [Hymenopellis radicata]|nr:hypothetical protein BDZ89DRAFT_535187 [Hymenopellis radicata]
MTGRLKAGRTQALDMSLRILSQRTVFSFCFLCLSSLAPVSNKLDDRSTRASLYAVNLLSSGLGNSELMHKINRPRRELSLVEAAEKAPSSRVAFQRLSTLLQENYKECPSLETRPNPSDNPNDHLNLAVQCLQALRTSLDRGLLELANSQAARSLLVQLYPSITSWLAYCIHHIVFPTAPTINSSASKLFCPPSLCITAPTQSSTPHHRPRMVASICRTSSRFYSTPIIWHVRKSNTTCSVICSNPLSF